MVMNQQQQNVQQPTVSDNQIPNVITNQEELLGNDQAEGDHTPIGQIRDEAMDGFTDITQKLVRTNQKNMSTTRRQKHQ